MRCTDASAFCSVRKKRGLAICSPALESGESLQANVNADHFISWWQRLSLYLATKADIPLASRGASNSERFNFAFNWTMQNHPQSSNFGQVQPLTIYLELALGITHRVIASIAFKSRKAWSFPRFQASEESFKCQVNSLGDVLQHLRVNFTQSWSNSFFIYRDKALSFIPISVTLILFPCIECDSQECDCTANGTFPTSD